MQVRVAYIFNKGRMVFPPKLVHPNWVILKFEFARVSVSSLVPNPRIPNLESAEIRNFHE